MRYSASQPQLPLGLKGETFRTIFGCNQSCLEALLLKRQLRGPSWVQLKGVTRVDSANQVCVCGGGGGFWLDTGGGRGGKEVGKHPRLH